MPSKNYLADILSSQSGASVPVPPPQQQVYVARQHIYVTAPLSVGGVTDPTLLGGALKTTWYHEGRTVPTSDARYSQSVDLLPDGTASATLIVANSTLEDAGVYSVEAFVLIGDTATLRLSIGEECREHVEKLTAEMGLERIVISSNEVNLALYGG